MVARNDCETGYGISRRVQLIQQDLRTEHLRSGETSPSPFQTLGLHYAALAWETDWPFCRKKHESERS